MRFLNKLFDWTIMIFLMTVFTSAAIMTIILAARFIVILCTH